MTVNQVLLVHSLWLYDLFSSRVCVYKPRIKFYILNGKPNISFHTNDLLNCFHFFLMYFTFSVSRTTTLSMCHHLFQLKTISCVVAVLYYLGKMVSLFLRDEKWSINILHVCQNSENMIEFVRKIGIWFNHKRKKKT